MKNKPWSSWQARASSPPSDLEPGYVVVFYSGDVLGCGLYSHGKLVSQIPKERRMAGFCGNELLGFVESEVI